jgi:hypothetical protein
LHVVLDVRFEVAEFGEVRKILARGIAQWSLEMIQVLLEHDGGRRAHALARSGFWHGEILAMVGRIC